MDYTLKVSKSRSHGLLEAFVGNCIRLYKLSSDLGIDRVYSDNKPGDDAGILAVMGLVLLSDPVHKRYLLLIAQLLECLLRRSKHNYHALLILVRIYLILGAGSLAMRTYKRLAIKNLQHETMAHVLYTRLATIYPHPGSNVKTLGAEKKDTNPTIGLSVALKSYSSSAKQAMAGKRLCLEKGRYNMLLGVLQVDNVMRQSFCKAMWVLEQRRMNRLTRSDLGEQELPNLSGDPGLSYIGYRDMC